MTTSGIASSTEGDSKVSVTLVGVAAFENWPGSDNAITLGFGDDNEIVGDGASWRLHFKEALRTLLRAPGKRLFLPLDFVGGEISRPAGEGAGRGDDA